jgi:energy-coupling factor transporter ATP-binding protein EcfA2
MAIKAVSLRQIQHNNGVFVLIYGKSGSGKTSCIRNFPMTNTVIISSEPQGLTSLVNFGWKDAKVICPTTSDGFSLAVEEAIADSSIKHIVLDSLSQYSEQLTKEYIEKSGKSVQSIGIALYRVVNLQFQKMVRRLLDALPMGKDVIGLIHMNLREESVGEERRVSREIALSGQLPAWVCRLASLVARAEKVKAGKEFKYMLIADGADGNDGKDLFGVAPNPIENDLWAAMVKIRAKQPVEEAKAEEAGISSYADLLRLGIKHKVSKTDIDALISSLEVDARSTSPDKWAAVYAAFNSKYVANF